MAYEQLRFPIPEEPRLRELIQVPEELGLCAGEQADGKEGGCPA